MQWQHSVQSGLFQRISIEILSKRNLSPLNQLAQAKTLANLNLFFFTANWGQSSRNNLKLSGHYHKNIQRKYSTLGGVKVSPKYRVLLWRLSLQALTSSLPPAPHPMDLCVFNYNHNNENSNKPSLSYLLNLQKKSDSSYLRRALCSRVTVSPCLCTSEIKATH